MPTELYSNFATTSMVTAILNPGDTSLAVAPTTGALFPGPAAGQFFRFVMVDSLTAPTKREVIYCTQRTGDTFNVIERAKEGTIAQTWIAGNFVSLRPTAGMFEEIVANSNASLLRSQLADTTSLLYGGTLVGFKQRGVGGFLAGAQGSTVSGKLQEVRSVWDFMTAAQIADCQGAAVLDVTAAFQAAHDSLPAMGGTIFVPPGAYSLTSVSITKQVHLRGAGMSSGGSYLLARAATNDVLDISGSSVRVSDIAFNAQVTQSAGSYIHLRAASSRITLDNLYMLGWFRAVIMDGVGDVALDRVTMVNGVPVTGGAVHINNTGVLVFLNKVLVDNTPGLEPAWALRVSNCADISLSECEFLHCVNGGLIDPGNGQVVASVNGVLTYFDNCTQYGLLIAPTGTGIANRGRFNTSWFSSCGLDGCLINAPVGTANGWTFISPHVLDNGGHGFNFVGANASRLTVIGGNFAGNAGSGIIAQDGVDFLTLKGNMVGPCGGFGANADGIRLLSGNNDDVIIEGNQVGGNTGAGIILGSTGARRLVRNNNGFVTENSGTATILNGTTSIVVAHGLNVTPTLKDIRLVAGENPTNPPGLLWVDNIGAANMTINCAADPGASNLDVGWQAVVLTS